MKPQISIFARGVVAWSIKRDLIDDPDLASRFTFVDCMSSHFPQFEQLTLYIRAGEFTDHLAEKIDRLIAAMHLRFQQHNVCSIQTGGSKLEYIALIDNEKEMGFMFPEDKGEIKKHFDGL
jgi:hypothetical protein